MNALDRFQEPDTHMKPVADFEFSYNLCGLWITCTANIDSDGMAEVTDYIHTSSGEPLEPTKDVLDGMEQKALDEWEKSS